MRDSSYVFSKGSGKAVHIDVSYEFGHYAVYIDDKYYGYGDTRAEADEIVQDYAKLSRLTETKPAKKKTSRSVGKQTRKVESFA